MLQSIARRTCRARPGGKHKSRQFFLGGQLTTCLFPSTQGVFLLFATARQWLPGAYDGNVSCVGNAQTSTSLAFVVTYQPGCASSPRTSGTRLSWLAPDWSASVFRQIELKSASKARNFLWKFFHPKFFCQQVVRESSPFKSGLMIKTQKRCWSR